MAKDLKDLSKRELLGIVRSLFDFFFFDEEKQMYNPELEVNGGDFVQYTGDIFENFGVVPRPHMGDED